MTLTQHILSILLQGLVVLVVSKVTPGFVVRGYGAAIGMAVVYGLLSWLLKWLLVLISLPFVLVTFGLFLLVINGFLLWITDKLLDSVSFKSKGALAVATVLITIGQWIVARVVT